MTCRSLPGHVIPFTPSGDVSNFSFLFWLSSCYIILVKGFVFPNMESVFIQCQWKLNPNPKGHEINSFGWGLPGLHNDEFSFSFIRAEEKRIFKNDIKFFAILFLPLKPRFTVKMHHITFEKKWPCSFPEVKNIQLLIDNDGRKPIAIGNLS